MTKKATTTATATVTGTKRLVLATSDVTGFIALRSSLVEEALRRRHKVVVFAPAVGTELKRAVQDRAASERLDLERQTLERLGASLVMTPFEARGFNPFGSYMLRRDLAGHLKVFAPHTVAVCDAAAAVALAPIARRVGVPRVVAMLPRLPLGEPALGTADKSLRQTLAGVTGLIVETAEERRAVLAADWIGEPKPVFVAPASGIDASRYPLLPLPPLQDGFVFALVSPRADQTARDVFQAASEHVARRAPQARFIVIDETDLGTALRSAHTVVHASTADGLCHGLLQALAAGRPVITSDVAASRDTVDERVNGCRVPPGDPVALAEAMASFLKRTDLIPAMARASRLKAERRFDLTTVNRITLDALGLDDGFAVAA